MRFWIDITDATNTIVGEGPIYNATRCTVSKRLSRAGEFGFELPATDERASLVTPRRNAYIYGMVNGAKTYLGGGTIDEIRTRIGADGIAMLAVRGGDIMRELARISVGKMTLDGTGEDNIAELLGAILGSPVGWTSYAALTVGPEFQARLVHENFLGALLAISEKLGASFRWQETGGDPRNLRWIYSSDGSGILATMHGDAVALESNPDACLITNIEIVEDSYDIKTRAFVYGAGEGESAITLASAIVWPDGVTGMGVNFVYDGQTYSYNAAGNYIRNVTAETAYGRDEIALAFKDIGPISNSAPYMQAAAHFLVVAAVEWLHAHRMPYKAYRLSVAGLRAALEPGQTIRVHARRFRDGEKPINVNELLYVLEVQTAVDTNGVRTTGLTVANIRRWPVSGDEEIVREMAKTTVLSAHPQTGPNVDTIPYREHLDDDHDATLYFWLGEETTTVQSVIVRFRVDPLRSTVKSIAGASTSSGPSSATTSGNGGGSTPTTGQGGATLNHSHSVEVAGLSGVSGSPVYFNTTNGLHTSSGAGVQNGPGTTLRDTNHTHTVTIPNHAHNMEHTHTFTPSITSAYGVFDDSGANTYVATDLEYSVNGSGYTAIDAGDAVSGASGWYQIDITASVSNATTYRPTQAANTVAFRVIAANEADKAAQLTVQIERRTSVQSIALF